MTGPASTLARSGPTGEGPDALPRRRVVLTLVLVVALLVVTGGYLLLERDRVLDEVASAPAVAQTDLAAVLAVPHVVFRSTALGPSYGKVSVVSLDDPAGPRAVTGLDCDRVASAAGRHVCLSTDQGVVTTYAAEVLGPDLQPAGTLPLVGLPSRTRLSGDAALATTTTFVAGHSYADGGFSTQTLVTDVAAGTTADLEDFTLVVDGRERDDADRNVWGVTFAGGDAFYATAASGGQTWLVRGNLGARTLTALREDAECPALSPDGRTVVYKTLGDRGPGQWRLAAYDLATGVETVLAETRTVDDQAEWLDDEHVLYGLPREGSEASVTDVWSVRVDGTGAPELLVPQAWSPAVVRTGAAVSS